VAEGHPSRLYNIAQLFKGGRVKQWRMYILSHTAIVFGLWLSLFPLHYAVSHFHYQYCHKHLWMSLLIGNSRLCTGLSSAKHLLTSYGITAMCQLPFKQWIQDIVGYYANAGL
jgi:hypothetical protein